MFDAVAAGANVLLPVVLMECGQHGVGAGLPVVGWFSVGAFLLVAVGEVETKASGIFVRRIQNSWERFCGGWTAFVQWGVAEKTCGARGGFGMVCIGTRNYCRKTRTSCTLHVAPLPLSADFWG